MTVQPILPDAPPLPEPSLVASDAGAFARALDAVSALLGGAAQAEDSFAYGRGTLQRAVYQRAQADVALSVATACAQRLAQAVQSVLNMQV